MQRSVHRPVHDQGDGGDGVGHGLDELGHAPDRVGEVGREEKGGQHVIISAGDEAADEEGGEEEHVERVPVEDQVDVRGAEEKKRSRGAARA